MPVLFKRIDPKTNKPRPIWIIRYVDRNGNDRQRSSKCADKKRAFSIGCELEERERDIREGRISQREIDAGKAALRPIADHLAEHLETDRERKLHPRHLSSKRTNLLRYFEAERVRYLSDIDAKSIERHMRQLVNVGVPVRRDGRATKLQGSSAAGGGALRRLSARSANVVRSNVLRFLSWAVEEGRLAAHPCPGRAVPKLNEQADRKRLRRAYTDTELEVLFRCLGSSPRRHVYRLAYLTGLRRNELASLRWGDVDLADLEPCLRLRAETTKNRNAEAVPLHPDAVAVLEEIRSDDAGPTDAVVERMPTVLQLYRDLDAAGVQRLNGREAVPDAGGRVLDFHSFRTTLGTMLARAGVPPLHAKRIMRHRSIETTDRHYTGLQLSDLGRQIERIPPVPVRDLVPTPVPTSSAPDGARRCESLRTPRPGRDNASRAEAVSLARLSDDVRGVASKRVNGLEPSTFSLGSCAPRELVALQDQSREEVGLRGSDAARASAYPSANVVGADPGRSAVLAELLAVLGGLPSAQLEALLAVAVSMSPSQSEAERRHA